MDINSAVGRDSGVRDEKLVAVSRWRAAEVFDTVEQLALEYAERMTYTDREVDDEFFGKLLVHFDEKSLVELTAIIGFENFSSKFNRSFRIEEQKLCVLPTQREEDAVQQ